MSGFKKESELEQKLNSIIREDEVAKLIKKYKKLRKFRKSNLHVVNKIDGRKDIIQELMDEYLKDKEI
jgi:hypothetical protein